MMSSTRDVDMIACGAQRRMSDETLHLYLLFLGVVLFLMIVVAWSMRG